MRKIIYKGLFFLCLLTAFSAEAQDLSNLIQVAIENNYQIQILSNDRQIAINNNTNGNAGMLPIVDFNASSNTSVNNTSLKLADGTERNGSFARNLQLTAGLTANWTLFDGYGIKATKDRLNLLEQVSEVDRKFYIEQTAADIALAYYQLIYENQLLDNYQQTLQISATRLLIESKRMEAGSATAFDYNQALVDYQSDSIRILSQENVIKMLNIELNSLVNQDLENVLMVTQNDFSFQKITDKEELLQSIKNQNQQLKLNRLQELLSETDQRLAQADKYPTIDLVGGVQFSQSRNQVGLVTRNQAIGPFAGINIRYNLFNGGNTERVINNAFIYEKNAQLSTAQTQQELDAQVLKLYYQHNSLVQRIGMANENVSATEKVYQTAEAQLRRGAIDGFDFRTTQLSLLSAQLVLRELEYNLKMVEINLNRYTGTVLEQYL